MDKQKILRENKQGKEEKVDQRERARKNRRLRTLQKQMAELGPVMRGSVVLIGTRNKQFYFSLNKEGKTKIIYLGKKRVEKAREYSDNHKQLLAIIEEMTMLNMELLKEDPNL